MFRSICLIAILAAASLTGCTNYYSYAPQPAVVMLQTNPREPAEQARIIINATGIRPASKHAAAINLTARIENLGRSPLTFEPQSMTVLDASLRPLPGPIGDLQPVTIDPGQAMLRPLEFPLSAGQSPNDSNLSVLNIRLTLRSSTGDVTQSLILSRFDYPGYYRYGPYPYSYGPYPYW